MEDFGYSKQQQENYFTSIVKKALMLAAGLFSIFFFLYITLSAYNYFLQNNEEIRTIEPQITQIKFIENSSPEQENSMQIDSSIYEDIFGTRKKDKNQKIKLRETTAAPAPPKPKQEEVVPEKKVVETQPEKIIVYSQDKIKEEAQVILDDKTPKKRRIRVQIAAMTSKNAAQNFSQNLEKQHSEIFSNLKSFVQEVDLGKRGIFYRVQIGDFYDQIRAENFCKKYIAKTAKSKSDCIVVE
jgi:hypothetical protein